MKGVIVVCLVLALSAVNCKKEEECLDGKCKKVLPCEEANCNKDLENCEIFTEELKTFAKCIPKGEYLAIIMYIDN